MRRAPAAGEAAGANDAFSLAKWMPGAGCILIPAPFFLSLLLPPCGKERAGVRRPMFTSTNPSPQPSPRLAGRGSCFHSVRVSGCTLGRSWFEINPTYLPVYITEGPGLFFHKPYIYNALPIRGLHRSGTTLLVLQLRCRGLVAPRV